jgi:hypothetical protein
MIIGVHALIYTKKAKALRAFFREALGFRHVDAGEGWLIFALPPAELAMHPSDGQSSHELYLLCDDIETTVRALRRKRVRMSGPIREARFGLVTAIKLPDGSDLGLYEPRHRLALKPLRRRAAKPRVRRKRN